MPIFEFTQERLVPVPETRFADARVTERHDLQRLIRDQIEVLGITSSGEPELLVLAEEFGDWEDSRRRIDLLALDRAANLVVIELKRTEDGGHMDLQALRYAAMVSALTFEKATELLRRHYDKQEFDKDPEQAILEFLEWAEPNEDQFAQDVRIILASAEFGRELTTAVMWLNQRDLDIQCIRLKPYQHRDRLLVQIEQVIPLPEATDYQVRLKEKVQEERRTREMRADQGNYRGFWEGLVLYATEHGSRFPVPQPAARSWVDVPLAADGLRVTASWSSKNGTVSVYLLFRGDDANKRFDALQARSDELEAALGQPVAFGNREAALNFDAGGDAETAYRWFASVLAALSLFPMNGSQAASE